MLVPEMMDINVKRQHCGWFAGIKTYSTATVPWIDSFSCYEVMKHIENTSKVKHANFILKR